jgi:hypothetical protein
MILNEKDVARFWARVDRETTPDGCWAWRGRLNAEGRGRFTAWGVTDYAYRVALRLTHGEIPEDAVVRHRCPGGGNPACCRPDHLAIEGGQRANNIDTVEDGRHRSAVLNPEKARRIRERYAAPDRPLQRELAREYGVSVSAVSELVTGKTWPRAGGPLRGGRGTGDEPLPPPTVASPATLLRHRAPRT